MQVFERISELKKHLSAVFPGKSVGLVPTMGALHEGHASLVKKSKKENDITICTVFVNPTQFNNSEDLNKYPRTLAEDITLLTQLNCDIVFAPSILEIYPEPDQRKFDLGSLDTVLEGAYRPGHFNGVAQVVSRLFEIVEPTRAYFGEKDLQQLAVIKRIAKTLPFAVEIKSCPTMRDKDGLAMSSRNKRLTSLERKAALLIPQTLFKAKEKSASLSPGELKDWVIKQFENNPVLRLEYFEIADRETFQPVNDWKQTEKPAGLIAVYAGDVRLIDNIFL